MKRNVRFITSVVWIVVKCLLQDGVNCQQHVIRPGGTLRTCQQTYKTRRRGLPWLDQSQQLVRSAHQNSSI